MRFAGGLERLGRARVRRSRMNEMSGPITGECIQVGSIYQIRLELPLLIEGCLLELVIAGIGTDPIKVSPTLRFIPKFGAEAYKG
jgi:hypothetical protein